MFPQPFITTPATNDGTGAWGPSPIRGILIITGAPGPRPIHGILIRTHGNLLGEIGNLLGES